MLPWCRAFDGLYSRDVVPDAGCRVLAGRLRGNIYRGAGQHYRSAETLPVYTNVFGKIGLVTLGVAVVMVLMVPWLNA
ncbi:hypothetical protein ACNKHR_14505 [Shigella flexneri]